MKPYFTLSERTHGLFMASLAGWFLIATILLTWILVADNSGIITSMTTAELSLSFLLSSIYGIPISLFFCQLIGHPAWFIAEILQLNTKRSAFWFGAGLTFISSVLFSGFNSDNLLETLFIATNDTTLSEAITGIVFFFLLACGGGVAGKVAYSAATKRKNRRFAS